MRGRPSAPVTRVGRRFPPLPRCPEHPHTIGDAKCGALQDMAEIGVALGDDGEFRVQRAHMTQAVARLHPTFNLREPTLVCDSIQRQAEDVQARPQAEGRAG